MCWSIYLVLLFVAGVLWVAFEFFPDFTNRAYRALQDYLRSIASSIRGDGEVSGS